MPKRKKDISVVSADAVLSQLLAAEDKPYGRVQVWDEEEIKSLSKVCEWILNGQTSRNKFVKFYSQLIEEGKSFDKVDPKKTKSAVDKKIKELLAEYE